jgi:hypothetical protein
MIKNTNFIAPPKMTIRFAALLLFLSQCLGMAPAAARSPNSKEQETISVKQDFDSATLRSLIAADAGTFADQIKTYQRDWGRFPGFIDDLKNAPTVSSAQLNQLNTQAATLKRQGEELRRRLEGIISKLRSNTKLFPTIDANVVEALGSGGTQAAEIIGREGGATSFLTQTRDEFVKLPSRIDELVSQVGIKSGTPSLSFSLKSGHSPNRAGGFTPSPPRSVSFSCLMLGSRLIVLAIQRTSTLEDAKLVVAKCNE